MTNPTTVVILVRHAEVPESGGDNPHLSSEGDERAKELARVLKESGVQDIFVSDMTRTLETAEPFAKQFIPPLKINKRERGDTLSEKVNNANALIAEIKGNHLGRKILIVGHSETIPFIIKGFGGGSINQIKTHDNLFILTVPKGGQTRMIRLKYGKE